jgi:hypothetical protein
MTTKPDPVQALTLKLGAVCEGEEPSVVLGSLVTVFACLTAPVDEETFKKSVDFFNDAVSDVRKELHKVVDETPQ